MCIKLNSNKKGKKVPTKKQANKKRKLKTGRESGKKTQRKEKGLVWEQRKKHKDTKIKFKIGLPNMA